MNDRDRARAALFSINPDVLSYQEWFRGICGALAAGLSIDDVGTWSSVGKKYKGRQDIEAKFRNITPDGGIGPGTLFQLAKKCGYQESGSQKPTHPPVKSGMQRSKIVQSPQSISDSLAKVVKNCEPATASHPYIQRKLGLTEGMRVYHGPMSIAGQKCDGALVLTLSDLNGKPVGLQFITLSGKKVFLPGVKLIPEACLVIGGQLLHSQRAYVVEGIGQAWTAHQATCAPAIVCFGKGRMSGVAKAIHARYPHLMLVIVPDADERHGRR